VLRRCAARALVVSWALHHHGCHHGAWGSSSSQHLPGDVALASRSHRALQHRAWALTSARWQTGSQRLSSGGSRVLRSRVCSSSLQGGASCSSRRCS
jgi:hypothetical protein